MKLNVLIRRQKQEQIKLEKLNNYYDKQQKYKIKLRLA